MHLHICRLVTIFGVLVLCSCNTTPAPVPGEGTSNSVEAKATQPTLTPSPIHLMAGLRCTNYVEAQWGTGLGDIGLCPASSDAWIRGPYAPKLNAQGDLFIVDKANQRILRYSGGAASQVIPIPSSYVLDDVCGYANQWPNVSVSEDRLFFLFSTWQDERIVDRLAVLSTEGQEQQLIDLEPYYPLRSPYLNSLISDREGGVYLLLPPAGVVHFDADLRPEFKYLGADDLSVYEGLVVGWDSNLYTYSAERDRLTNWGAGKKRFTGPIEPLSWRENVIAATQIVSPTYTRLLGADTQGRLYFRTCERGRDVWLIRVSASGDERVIAAVPEGEPPPSSLAPDGSLYSIAYDPTDTSVKPRIVRCVFDQD